MQPVYEVTLPTGFGYVCVLHRHPTYGDVLGVDPTVCERPSPDPTGIVHEQVVIFPIEAAIKAQSLSARHVGDRVVEEPPPLCFKFAVRDKNGDPIYWWLWDGDEIKIAGDDLDLDAMPERKVLTPQELIALWV